MERTLVEYVFKNRHIKQFLMAFEDGEIKPAYLFTDIKKLLGKEIQTQHLEEHGLIKGIHFMVKNASELPDGVQTMNVLGAANGQRTVLSLDGFLKLVIAERTQYGIEVREWLSTIVIPKLLRAHPEATDPYVLTMIRNDIDVLTDSIRYNSQYLGLEEVDQTSKDLAKVKVKTNFIVEYKTQIVIGAAVVALGTIVIIYVRKKRKIKKLEES